MQLRGALVLVVLPSLGFAATVEDRYGPPPAPRPAPAVGQALASGPQPETYRGRFLTWPGRDPATPRIAVPAPISTASAAPRPAYRPPSPDAGPPAGALPASLYEPRPRAEGPKPFTAPPRLATAAPAPPPASAPPPAPAARPVQVAAAQPLPPVTHSTPVRARFYSLHREYGDTPDPVSLPPARPMVLIGPSEAHPDAEAEKPAKDAADAAIF